MKKITTIGFKKRAMIVHGDRYDYSQVEYLNNKTVVHIRCKVHGLFEQTPSNHLAGQNCPICVKRGKGSVDRFILRAIEIYGHKYNYSKVDYVNNRTKVNIICPKHGTFEQLPTGHLNGNGCPLCNGGVKITREEFIKRAILVHGNFFNYSNSKYVDSQTKLKIICPEHGVFKMKPNNHLSGQGCPECSNVSFGEKYIANWLNENSISFERQKTFEECKNIRLLRYDFYIPNKNILIEYDGKQHYQSIKYFGGDNTLRQTQQNDKIKNDFANDNKINLLRIRYDERNQLSEILKNNII